MQVVLQIQEALLLRAHKNELLHSVQIPSLNIMLNNGQATNGKAHESGPKLPPQSFDSNVKEVEFGSFDHSGIPLEKEERPVIIIGSSMVGMMTGLLLGYHGYVHEYMRFYIRQVAD